MDNKTNPKDINSIPQPTKKILFEVYPVRQFPCPYPNCNKCYTAHNRLKIHLRTHVYITINLYK